MINEMTKEQKKIWVDALRSGKYQQGRGCLKQENDDGTFSYCCLGVANEELDLGSYARTYISIPSNSDIENHISYGTQRKLWVMNDRDGKSFAEIADWIEENL